MTENENSGGIIAAIQRLPQPVRVLIFSVTIVIFLAISVGGVGLLYYYNANSLPRTEPVALQEGQVSVREFVTWDDPQTYPAALAIRENGVLYTGSYATGTVWRIAPDGSRAIVGDSPTDFGAIAGLDIGADGTLYILDRIDPLNTEGAIIWQLVDDTVTEVIRFPAEGDDALLLPNDIAVDDAGNIYVTDLQARVIWKVPPDAAPLRWWSAPDDASGSRFAPAGLAYDATRDGILIADATAHTISLIPLDTDNTRSNRQELYRYTDERDPPGFNGVTVAPDGTIYAAGLSVNRVMRIHPDDNSQTYIAGGFRGASDVAYDATRQRLYVTNWDQRSLLPGQFLGVEFDLQPRLPFSVDVVELSDAFFSTATEDDTADSATNNDS